MKKREKILFLFVLILIIGLIMISKVKASNLGDLNSDNKSDSSDILIILKYILGIDQTNSAADVNGDGKVNLLDLVNVSRYFGTVYGTDTTPPSITNSTFTNNTAFASGTTSVTFFGITSEKATCKYANSSSGNFTVNMTTFNKTGSISQFVNFSGLSGGNIYKYYIQCQDSAGNTNTTNYMINFTVNSSFQTPDILNGASFESGDGDGSNGSSGAWDNFTNWGAGTPSCIRATDQAYWGNYSAEYDFTSNPGGDAGCHMTYHFANEDRVWVRFYFKLTNHITTTWKWARVADTGFTNFGGVWLEKDGGGLGGNGVIDWGWDSEDSSIITTIGLNESQVIDGNWHSLEFEYCRNNCTNSDNPNNYPFACFWFDGKQQYAQLNGTSSVKYYGAGNSDYWANGCLYAGERSSTNQIGYQNFMSTLNQGNTATGQSNIDNISISSLGRIGP